MKICETCQKEIKSRRLKICDSCYSKVWWEKNKPPPKKKERSAFCLLCGKQRERSGRSIKYCNSCAFKKFKKKNPHIHEKIKSWSRYYQRRKKGLPLDAPLMKEKNGNGHLNKQGYRILCRPGHPNSLSKKGNIAEHTLVMCEHIGRPLKKGETIHHINGVRDDNRIENLELWHRSHPPGQRVQDKIAWAKEFLEEYGYDVKKR